MYTLNTSNKRTTMSVSKTHLELLKNMGRAGDSMDHVLGKLLMSATATQVPKNEGTEK